MRENFPHPPKMILTFVPEVGAGGQDGATESAGLRLVIDVETGALVAGGLAMSGTHANTAVHPVRLSKLQERAGPVFEDVGERGGGPLRVPWMVAGGLFSVFRKERRWLRPGLVRTGG